MFWPLLAESEQGLPGESQGVLPGIGRQHLQAHAAGCIALGSAVLRRNFLASSVCCSPPGVCLWSPDQISKHVRGVRAAAIVAASSMLPHC